MNLLLKKYFWVFTLATVGLSSILGGRTASHLIAQTWLGADETQNVAGRRGGQIPEKSRTKEVDAIVKRNVFCSSCQPITPSSDNPLAPDGPTSNEPRKTELPLELVSTMVVPCPASVASPCDDEKWSMAIIRDLSTKEKDSALYRRGDELPGGDAKVEWVIEKKVYIINSANGGRREFLEMEGAVKPDQPRAEVAMTPGADPLDNDINRGVRCSGSNCEIDRPLLDKLLANTTMLATAARFVPSIKDGRPNGFKLYAIRPNSIFGKIGMQNGDTVKSINGMEMSSPDQALGVYTKVRSASHLTVAVERRGETVTLDYTIR